MLDKNVLVRDTIRMFLSEVQKFEIDSREEANDAKALQIINKMIKQRNESCEVYKKAGRNELLENETKEIKVISAFLPKQLGEEETIKICQEAIKSSGASSMKDIGKVMGVLKSKHADTLDFSKVSSIIKGLLN